MADKSKKLSDTARALLTLAATRGDHLIQPPRLPIAAARQVVRSLLNAGLAEEVPAPIEDAGFGAPAGIAVCLCCGRRNSGSPGWAKARQARRSGAHLDRTRGEHQRRFMRRGGRAGSARYELGRIRFPAGSGRRAERPPRGDSADTTTPGHGDTTLTAVEPPGAVQAPTAAQMPCRDTAASGRLLRPSSTLGTLAKATATTRWTARSPLSVLPWPQGLRYPPRLKLHVLGRTQSRRRFWLCCAITKAPVDHKSPKRWVGRRIPFVGSSPASPRRVSR